MGKGSGKGGHRHSGQGGGGGQADGKGGAAGTAATSRARRGGRREVGGATTPPRSRPRAPALAVVTGDRWRYWRSERPCRSCNYPGKLGRFGVGGGCRAGMLLALAGSSSTM